MKIEITKETAEAILKINDRYFFGLFKEIVTSEDEEYQLVDIKGKPTNKLPVTVTHCKNKEHAGQLILSAVSQFGKIDEEGLYEFINEFAVDINSLETFDLPDFDVDRFIKGYKGETPEDEEPTGKSQTTICPACGAEF